jgi:type II secretory pathway pseudopilin PulG
MKEQPISERAFTLAELLVAVGITVLIVVMLGIMFGSMINTASRTNHRIDAFRDARAAFQIMRRDFEGLVKVQPAVYFSLDPDGGGTDMREVCGLVSAKNQPPTGSPGDVCAVRYYAEWESAARRYTLHRYFKDSSQTYNTFKANLSNQVLGYTSGTSMYYDGVGADDAVATCAWDLQVVAYDNAGNVINSVNDVYGHPTTGPYTCDPTGSTNALPQSIELSFKAMGADAARTIIAATSGRSDGYNVWGVVDNASPASGDLTLYDNLIKPYAYDFRTRIYFNR